MISARQLTAPLLAAMALAGCTADIAPPSTVLAQGAHYVAMGSSYAAGARMQPVRQGEPVRCGRSQINYATLLADRLSLDLTDASCDGATSHHLLGPWDELPAQLDALDTGTQLVTITVGGNDLGYMQSMFAASCRAGVASPMPVDEQAGECSGINPPDGGAYGEVEGRLVAIADEVRRRAPDARIVFVQYVSLVSGDSCDAAPLLPEDVPILREIATRLAQATASAAQRTNALVLPTDQLSASHTACDAAPWSNAFANGYEPTAGAPWHPNAAGHAAIADALAELLTS